MFTKRRMRFFSVVLSFVFFSTNCVLGYAPQNNLWSERKQQRSEQYASLPAGFNPLSALPLQRSLPNTASVKKPALQSQIKNLSTANATQILPLLSVLPASLGTIRKIIPAEKKSSNRIVIAIEDVHLNEEAQDNIRQATRNLIQTGRVNVIGLEGAFASIDLKPYQTFPHQEAVQRLADYLLSSNRISGPVHAAMVSGRTSPKIFGVDDNVHYHKNIQAYKESFGFEKKRKAELQHLTNVTTEAKKIFFSESLREFDDVVEKYRSGAISIVAYAEAIAKGAQSLPESFEVFLEAAQLEATLNFNQVENERSRVIAVLLEKLTKPELAELANQGLAFRLGQISHSEFYGHLKAICRTKGVQLASYPIFNSYLQYVLLSDAVQAERLFEDLQRLENNAFAALATTEDEKKIIQQAKLNFLSRKLMDFSLTREEWNEYKTLENIHTNYGSFKAFYEEAEARDQAMASNLVRQMQEGDVAILVSGGFHSSGIAKQLAQAGVTTVSFTPKLTRITDEKGSAYLSVFAQEKSPLDQVLQGQKLFLAQPPLNVTPSGAAPIVIADAEAADRSTRLGATEVQKIAAHFGLSGPVTTGESAADQAFVQISEGRLTAYFGWISGVRKLLRVQFSPQAQNVVARMARAVLNWFSGFRARIATAGAMALVMANSLTAQVNPSSEAPLPFLGTSHWNLVSITGLAFALGIGMVMSMTGARERRRPEIPAIVWPGDIGSTEVRYTGGKGANLNMMELNGDPGKINVVVSPSVYDRHITANLVDYKGRKVAMKEAILDLTMGLEAADPQARIDAEKIISAWIEESPLEVMDAHAIDQAYFELSRKEISLRIKELLAFVGRLNVNPSLVSDNVDQLGRMANRLGERIPLISWEKWSQGDVQRLKDSMDGIIKELKGRITPIEMERMKNFYQGLLVDIEQGVQVAVRSTGVLEDLKYAAFPGQYSTFLNIRGVDNIRKNVLRDWSSNYTERVIGYRDEEILKYFGRDERLAKYMPGLVNRLNQEPRMQQLGRFFQALQANAKSTLESGSSSLRFLRWLESQPSDWEDREALLQLLTEPREFFINPESVKIAVVLHVQSQGIDKDRHPMERLTAANVFTVDTTSGFTGWVFGSDENGNPAKRSRILYVNSVYGLGEALVQGKVTGDTDIYMAFDDEQGKRRYVLIGQQLGEKAVWTATKEAAEEALRLAEAEFSSADDARRLELAMLIEGIQEAMQKAIEEKQKTMDVPTPSEARAQFVLTNEEKLNLVKAADRSTDIYALRIFLQSMDKRQRRQLMKAVQTANFDEEVQELFQRFIDDPMAYIPPHLNPLGVFWHWIYTSAPEKTREKYIQQLPLIVKDMETSLPSRLGRRAPIMIQSRDFAKETDQDSPSVHKDNRSIIDVEALKAQGFDVTVHPNGFIEAEHKDGRRIVPIIGDASTSAIATSMAATGFIRNLRHGKNEPLPEHQITLRDGQKVFFMVADETAPEHLRAMQNSLGVVTRRGTKTSHAAIESLGMRIATVVGTQPFLDKLKSASDPERAEWVQALLDTDDIQITVDGNNGFVYLASDPTIPLTQRSEVYRKSGNIQAADRILYLLKKYENDVRAVSLPTKKLNIEVDLNRLPRLKRAVGWIMSNAAEAWRTTKIGLSKIHYSVALLRAEFSFGYVGIHPRAIVAHELMTLLKAQSDGSLAPAESDRLDYLINNWGIVGVNFSKHLSSDVKILLEHPEIVKQIDQRIKGFVPAGWKRPSAIYFFKQTHGGNVGSLAAAFPWHKQKVYRFIDFKLREMKELVGGKIFFENIHDPDSMNGFRGTTYLLSAENLSTFILEIEVLAQLSKQGIDVDPMFAFVRSPEQLERSLKIAGEVFRREGTKPRSIGMMVEIPINVFEADRFAQILNKFAEKMDIDWFFSYGTNDLSQGLFQFGRDVPALHGVSIGNEVSDYTKKSPFVEQRPDGTYSLRGYDEGRVEVYRSIAHAARVAKKYPRGSVSLCGEALNKLSVQNPEQAAAVAGLLDAGGSSVPNFMNVVKVFAAAELLNGTVDLTPALEKKLRRNGSLVIENAKSSLTKGAADRTLVVVEKPGDLLNVYPGDFVLIQADVMKEIQALDKTATETKAILARMDLVGAYLILDSRPEAATIAGFTSRTKKPILFLGTKAFNVISKLNSEVVTVDFEKGRVYKGRLPIVEKPSNDADLIEIRLRGANGSVAFNTMESILYSAGNEIKAVGTHPEAVENKEKFYRELFETRFRAIAQEARAQGKKAIFQIDSLRVSDYMLLKEGEKYEAEETNPSLGLKGIFRYLVKAGYDREWLLEAQMRAAFKIHEEMGNVALLVTGANVPELSAEAERIYSRIDNDVSSVNALPLGIQLSAPAQIVNLEEHIKVGKYSFVYIDEQELPYATQLSDPRNELLRSENHTPQALIDRLQATTRKIVLSTLSEVNAANANPVQIAVVSSNESGHAFENAGGWASLRGFPKAFALGAFTQMLFALVLLPFLDAPYQSMVLVFLPIFGGIIAGLIFNLIYIRYGNSHVAQHLGFGEIGRSKGELIIREKLLSGEDAGRLIRISMGFTSLWIWGNSRFLDRQSPVDDEAVLLHELMPWHSVGLMLMVFVPAVFLLTLTLLFVNEIADLFAKGSDSELGDKEMREVARALVGLAVAQGNGGDRSNAQLYFRAVLPGASHLNRQIASIQRSYGGLLKVIARPQFNEAKFVRTLQDEIVRQVQGEKLNEKQLISVMEELAKFGLPIQGVADVVSGAYAWKKIVLVANSPEDAASVQATLSGIRHQQVTILVDAKDESFYAQLVRGKDPDLVSRVQIKIRAPDLINEGSVVLSRIEGSLSSSFGYDPKNTVLMLSRGLSLDTTGVNEEQLRNLVVFFIDQVISGIAMKAIDIESIHKIARAAAIAA